MPTLKQIKAAGYVQTNPEHTVSTAVTNAAPLDQQPGLSPFMRCPLPPVFGVSPDSLRQFYRGGTLPQRRLLSSSGTAGGGAISGNSVVNPTINNTIGNGSTIKVPQNAKLLGSNSQKSLIAATLTNSHVYVGNAGNAPVDVPISGDIALANTGQVAVTGLESVPLDETTVGHPLDGQVVTYVSSAGKYEAVYPTVGSIPLAGSLPIEIIGTNPYLICLEYGDGLTLDGSDHLELNLGTGLAFSGDEVYAPIMVGDSGSGGVAGLAPAPPAGSSAAGKFLKADGSYEVPSGSTINFVVNEVVSFSGTSGTLANTPVLGSQALYKNGQRLAPVVSGVGDYTISGANITLVTAAISGDFFLADYRY